MAGRQIHRKPRARDGVFRVVAGDADERLLRRLCGALCLQTLLGIGESGSFPSMSKILADNVGEAQRGFANGLVQAGLALGPAFGLFAGGTLIAEYGWRPFFIGCGAISILWIAAWLAVSRGHLRSINASQSEDVPALALVLREPSLWGASLGHFFSNFLLYFIVTWIPYYLLHERNWTLPKWDASEERHFLNRLSDDRMRLRFDRLVRNGVSPTLVRKSAFAIGGLGASDWDARVRVLPRSRCFRRMANVRKLLRRTLGREYVPHRAN